MSDYDEKGLGARFWLWVVGLAIGGAIAVALLFLVIGWAWYAWGFLGAFLFFALVALAFGYFFDRRQASRRGSLAG